MQENNLVIEKELRQIADMLLLNGTLTECPGLVRGKMGIAIFFFHYAQYTKNELFSNYAMDVISEILNQIHVNSPADYEDGIAGIGVGVDYLIRNNFLDVEGDLCEELDQRMVRAVMYDPWQDLSMYDGLTGYGRYWMTRLHFQTPALQASKCLLHIIAQIEHKLPDISITEQTDIYCFLHDLQRIASFENCAKLLKQYRKRWELQSPDMIRNFHRLGDAAVGNILRIYLRNRYFNTLLQDEIDFMSQQTPDPVMEKQPVNMGLLNGYAGEGMLRLTALRKTDDSWMFLL